MSLRPTFAFCCAAWLLGASLAQASEAPAAAARAPLQAVNTSAPLYAQLPAEVRKAGRLRFVGDSHPPYRIVGDDRQIHDGLDPDLARGIERLLGVPIVHYPVNSLSAILAGLESGRYDVTMGPALATRERQLRFDGISWMVTKPSFVYPTSRPAHYERVEDLCGKKISYVAGSVTERHVNRVVERCVAAGRPASVHVPLVDTNMTLIATQAGRADLAGMTLTAALHAVHVNGDRFKAFSDDSNSLGIDLLSLFVTKRSGLGPVMLQAMQMLMQSGEYQRVMDKWGVAGVSVQTSQLNAMK